MQSVIRLLYPAFTPDSPDTVTQDTNSERVGYITVLIAKIKPIELDCEPCLNPS